MIRILNGWSFCTVLLLFCRPCIAAGDAEKVPEFFTLRLSMGVILGACAWIIGNRFPRFDQRIPAVLAICGFIVGYAAGHVLFLILLGAAAVGGLGYLVNKHSSEIFTSLGKWNQDRLSRKAALNQTSFVDSVRQLAEKRDRDLDEIDAIDNIDHGTRSFLISRIIKQYEEDLRRITGAK